MSRTLVALAIVGLLFAACGKGEEERAQHGDSPPVTGTPPAPSNPAPGTVPPSPAPPPQTTPTPAPAANPNPAAPAGNLRGSADAGKALYAQYCTTCHGATGHGDGPAAAGLNPKPANHSDHVYMGGLSDEHIYQVISKGGASVGKSPMMAPWGGVINDQGIKDLIAYLRQLSNT